MLKLMIKMTMLNKATITGVPVNIVKLQQAHNQSLKSLLLVHSVQFCSGFFGGLCA